MKRIPLRLTSGASLPSALRRPIVLALRMKPVLFAVLFAAQLSLPAGGQENARPEIPVLRWEQRSDWKNVKTLGAIGDGVADDTDALQSVLDASASGTTVYFPPGTYKTTKSLTIVGAKVGFAMIGHGRETRLLWAGPAGGNMIEINGLPYTRYEGFEMDGAGLAANGMVHFNTKQFETEIRHQHLAFKNLTGSAVEASTGDKYAMAETSFENCLFEKCGTGVRFPSFNDYDIIFDGCEFRGCGTGIFTGSGNFYARNSHFEGSTLYDIDCRKPEHGCSIRRCTSTGSNRFIYSASSVSPLTIENCHVADWTGMKAGELNMHTNLLFDNVFTNSRNPNAPLSHKGKIVEANNQPPLLHPPANQFPEAGPTSEPSLTAQTHFLRSEVPIPGKVFDVKAEFHAVANGRADDTAAAQAAIDAARAHGRGAIAYFPAGRYTINKTLTITGGDYYVGGSGVSSALLWKGEAGGTMIEVRDPQNITLENISVSSEKGGTDGLEILQTGGKGASRMTYEGVFVYGKYAKDPLNRGLMLKGLGKGEVVTVSSLMGNIRIDESAEAIILLNITYEGSLTVTGKSRNRSGFLGVLTRLCTHAVYGLSVRDNQNIVVSDFYMENTDSGYLLSGDPNDPPGHATFSSPKLNFRNQPTNAAVTINNYTGVISLVASQFHTKPEIIRFLKTGTQPVTLNLVADAFYGVKADLTGMEAPCSIYALGNNHAGLDLAADHPGSGIPADALPADPAVFRRILDDYRMLGKMDLEINHGWKR